jgi:hypothetical protein
MAIQSQFSKLSKKQLVFICEKLIDEEFPIGNPYENDFDAAFSTLESISKYFNISIDIEDVEFFSKLLEINEDLVAELFANNRENIRNKELIDRLIIPKAEAYKLHYEIYGTCSFTEYKSQEFDSYDKYWVKDTAEQRRQDGSWDFWEGYDREVTDYENYQVDGETYGHVYKVEYKEKKDNFVSDSILDKLVIENTENVVSSLDRQTLLKLKSIIDSKLGLS